MKVLIVDDDQDVRGFLSDSIRTLGAERVEIAESGEEALARALKTRFDLVTLDIKMSGVSGIDILSVIRGLMPWAVIAIVSGYTEEVSEDALDHTDLVLAKPVRMGVIKRLVDLTGQLVRTREEIGALGNEENE